MNNENAAITMESSSHKDAVVLHIMFVIIICIAFCFGVKNLYYETDYNKIMTYGGLTLSIIGTYLVGPIANGIPRKGDRIKAPKRIPTISGWFLIMVGFLISAIGTLNL